MSNKDLIVKQADELLKTQNERDEAVEQAKKAHEEKDRAVALKDKWYGLAQSRQKNFQSAKKDREIAMRQLTTWKNTYLPLGKWFRKLYDGIMLFDKLFHKR